MHGKAFNMMALARMQASGRHQSISVNPLSNLDRQDIPIVKILDRLPSSRSRSLNESIIDEKDITDPPANQRRMKKMKVTVNVLAKNLDKLVQSPNVEKPLVLCRIEKILLV